MDEKDKNLERNRYDLRSREMLKNGVQYKFYGANSIPPVLRTPYIEYERCIKNSIFSESKVLEIGAGYGMHTELPLELKSYVVATDISLNALTLLREKFKGYENLETAVMDMERIQYPDNSFDFVVSAGSLSYGDAELVMNEIYRVLKPGGAFICVDSLANNPVYNFYRVFTYALGKRSKSTLKNMPKLETLAKYRRKFTFAEISYFGSVSYLAAPISGICGSNLAKEISDWFDRMINTKGSAYKFVMRAVK